MSDFEIVDASSVQFVKRGRKLVADENLVKALKALGVGKAMVIAKMKQDPKSSTFANDKARIASQIRTACKSAGLKDFRILWSPEGVPQVVR